MKGSSDVAAVLAIALGTAGSVTLHAVLAERASAEPPDVVVAPELRMRVMFAPLLEMSPTPTAGPRGDIAVPAPSDGGDLWNIVDADPVAPHEIRILGIAPDSERRLERPRRRPGN